MTVSPDKPRNALIFGMLIVSVVTIVALCVAIQQLFNNVVTTQVSEKQLEPVNSQLKALREEEALKLSVGRPPVYAWVDEKAGVVRIPVDRAVELTLRDWSKRPTAPVPAGGAAPAPAPAAAPADGAAGTTPEKTPAPAAPAPAPAPK